VRVRLDHAATASLRPEAAAAVAEAQASHLGNPSAVYASGRRARRMLDDARDELAELLGARPGEVVFTSGGTESDDLAIHGVAAGRPGRVLCSAVEHEAVLEPVRLLDGRVVAVDPHGRLSLEALEHALVSARDDGGVALVSVMLVNNENGVRQPLDEAAALVRELVPGTPVHTDAVQAAGWLDLGTAAAAADLVSISGHKFGAPVGVGALVVRDGTPLVPRLLGGGQERERRSGTSDVAGAVGLAAAARAVAAERAETVARVAALRDRLADGLAARIPGIVEPACATVGDRSHVVGGTVQVCIEGVEGEALLFLLDEAGIEASAGSACAAGALDPSHVLAAMGVPRALARGALRLSLGHDSTDEDVDRALAVIPEAVERLRRGRAA
jgi:cysteine desulfurase